MAKKAAPSRGSSRAPARGGKSAGKSAPPKRGSSSDYADYLAKKAKSWEKSRKREPQSRFVEVPEGTYVARVTKADIKMPKGTGRPGREPVPSFNITYAVMEPGDYFGAKVSSYDDIDDTPIEAIEGQPSSLDFLSERIQLIGYAIEDLDLRELPKFAKDLTAEKPWVRIRVKHNTYTPTQGPNAGKEKKVVRVFVQNALDDQEVAEWEEDIAAQGLTAPE